MDQFLMPATPSISAPIGDMPALSATPPEGRAALVLGILKARQKLALAALVTVVAFHASPASAQQMDCGVEGGLKALAGQPHVGLSFHNPHGQPRRLYWIDFQGHRKPYGIIAAGADRKQDSSIGNHWVVTDEADKCIAIFAANATANTFVIPAPGTPTIVAARPAATSEAGAPAATTPPLAAQSSATLGTNPPVAIAPAPVPPAPVAIGPMITPDGFARLFPPAGSPPAPTSTIVLTPQGPVMVTSTAPPPGSAAPPPGPAITLDALNALLFPSGNPCGAPTSTTVLSPAGPRIVSALRAPRPGVCGVPAAPAPAAGAVLAQPAPPATTTK